VINTDAPLFGRIITAMVTPFDDSLEIDYGALERVVEHLIATGTDSLLVSGTTGESPTLEGSERIELFKFVKQLSGPRHPVILGVGTNCTKTTATNAQEAERLGADGILVIAPYYNKPDQRGLILHFTAVAQAVSLPVIVYNIPGRTGCNISPETMIALAESCPNIHAIKDSTGGVDQAASMAGNIRDSFRIYSGDDYLTLPFLSVGACGVVSVASHLIGRSLRTMIDQFFAGKLDIARELHYKYLPLFKELFAAPNPICVKYALSYAGIIEPYLRPPLCELDSAGQAKLAALMKELEITAQLTRA